MAALRCWALAAAAGLAACTPADNVYYARGKAAQAVQDGFAAAAEYDRYLQSRKAHPSSAADIALAPRPGTYGAVALERDRIVLVLDSNWLTGKVPIAGKRVTFSAQEVGGKRTWSCARGELEPFLMPETCR